MTQNLRGKVFDNQTLEPILFSTIIIEKEDVERNTKFANNFGVNVLWGYEWKIKDFMLLSVNLKGTWVGGKRFIPIKFVEVDGGSDWQYDYDNAYSERLPDYLRLDVNVNMKVSYRNFAIEWFAELDNVTNRKNIFSRVWNSNSESYSTYYQMALFPMG